MATSPQLHIAVWGVGAMGSLFGGYLSAVARVTMVGAPCGAPAAHALVPVNFLELTPK